MAQQRGKMRGDIELPAISLWVVVLIVAIVGVFAYASYSYASTSVGGITSKYKGQAPTAIGNGKSMIEIPITVTNRLGAPMRQVDVAVRTDIGHVNGCRTDDNGTCSVTFVPPVTSSGMYATVGVNVGGLIQTIPVRVNADTTARLDIQSTNMTMLADGRSSAQINVTAYNSINSAVPDGTALTFSLSPDTAGSLSVRSCNTSKGGACLVTFKASTTPGNVTFRAGSYNVSASLRIALLPLLATSVTMSSSVSSLDGDGKSTLTVTAEVKNNLSKPIPYANVTFTADKGTIQKFCATDLSGSCKVIYSAPNLAGTARLTASVPGSKSNGSLSITLLPVTGIQVSLSVSDIVGAPIVPAFALNYQYLGQNMTTVTIRNTGSGKFNGSVRLSVPGWSDTASQEVSINPSATATINLNPNLNSVALSNLNEQAADYVLTVLDSSGQTVHQSSFATNITAFNTMRWTQPAYGDSYDKRNDILLAWMQPNNTKVQKILADANSTNESMPGYNTTYKTGCGSSGLLKCNQSETTRLQLKAIVDQLDEDGMDYSRPPAGYFTGEQSVYAPSQSILVKGGNTLDGSLTIASAAYAIKLYPYIALAPDSAFVCVQPTKSNSTNSTLYCIDSTKVYDFSIALNEGRLGTDSYVTGHQLTLLNVSQILPKIKLLPQ